MDNSVESAVFEMPIFGRRFLQRSILLEFDAFLFSVIVI
jgi:hypothetical protein